MSWIYVAAICLLVLGMFSCVLLAAHDNYSEEYGGEMQTAAFILFTCIMLVFFIIGTGVWGYENMGDYYAHNIAFYLLFVAVVTVSILLYIRRRGLQRMD